MDSILLQFAELMMLRCLEQSKLPSLQSDIDKLIAWCRLWQLSFNVSKCNLLHLGPSHTFDEYTIDGSVMISNDTVRDLGVLTDNRLKFHCEHVSTVTKKANRILAICILHKTF